MPHDLAQLLVAFFVAAASPGPATIAVSTVALSSGMSSALLFALGLSTGLAAWGFLAAFGLGALLVQSTVSLAVLKIAGGGYLLWLAWKSALSAIKRTNDTTSPTVHDERNLFISGVVLNLSNPKAVITWISVLALGTGSTETGTSLMVDTSLCATLGLGIYLGYAALFSRAWLRRGYARLRQAIEGLAAAFFAYAGLSLLQDGMRNAVSSSRYPIAGSDL